MYDAESRLFIVDFVIKILLFYLILAAIFSQKWPFLFSWDAHFWYLMKNYFKHASRSSWLRLA